MVKNLPANAGDVRDAGCMHSVVVFCYSSGNGLGQ